MPTIDIVRRLDEVNQLGAANSALEADIKLRTRFYTVGFIYADNAEARAFLTANGANPDAILAPT